MHQVTMLIRRRMKIVVSETLMNHSSIVKILYVKSCFMLYHLSTSACETRSSIVCFENVCRNSFKFCTKFGQHP